MGLLFTSILAKIVGITFHPRKKCGEQRMRVPHVLAPLHHWNLNSVSKISDRPTNFKERPDTFAMSCFQSMVDFDVTPLNSTPFGNISLSLFDLHRPIENRNHLLVDIGVWNDFQCFRHRCHYSLCSDAQATD